MERKDYMPLFTGSFLGGTHKFTAAEIGGYILLLFEQWHNDYLPTDHEKLMEIGRVNSKQLVTILKKFKLEPLKGYYNVKCKKVRDEYIGKVNQSLSTTTNTELPAAFNANIQAQNKHNEFAKQLLNNDFDMHQVNLLVFRKANRMLVENDLQRFSEKLDKMRKIHTTYKEWFSHLQNWINASPSQNQKQEFLNSGSNNTNGGKVLKLLTDAEELKKRYGA